MLRRRWLLQRDDMQSLCRYRLEHLRQREVLEMLGEIRAAIGAVYASENSVATKLEAKAALLASVDAAYARLQATWEGPPKFDHWFTTPFNNARFAVLATYDDDVPAFAALLAQSDGDLDEFYRRAAELADQPAGERRAGLDALRTAATQEKPGATITCPPPG